MRASFSGIEIARRALQAQQRSLDVVGHNVANANTPGYSRQVAVHAATRPYTTPQLKHHQVGGQVGTGVTVQEITRVRDQFVETRLRQEGQNLGYWQELDNGLHQIQLIFNEPSDTGIHNALDEYWDSLQELSKHPENEATRAVVVQRAEVLAETIRHIQGQLIALRDNMNETVSVYVSRINSIGQQIAQLNEEIGKVSNSGNNPNDLLDKRDVLLEELSQIVNIEVVADSNNMVSVSISGVSLVQRSQYFGLKVVANEDADLGYRQQQIVWEDTNSPAEVRNGELKAVLELRDGEIQNHIDALNEWTKQFVVTVNAVHRSGYNLLGAEPGDFFVGLEHRDVASNIRVNADLIADPKLIAAGYHTNSDNTELDWGNGHNAVRLASLRYDAPNVFENLIEQYLEENSYDFGKEFVTNLMISTPLPESYNSIISQLGVRANEAINMTEKSTVMMKHLYGLRESASGVNLDEEMADMIRFQHAYNAAARVMTAMDEALEIIVNRLGVVGR